MKIKDQSQRLLLFLIFPILLKINKDQIFKPKTLLKTCRKTLVKIKNFALLKTW